MKYKFDFEINLDQGKIFELSLDRPSLLLWQSGVSDIELISGTPGEPGVKHKLTTEKKNKKLEIIETITSINRPYEYKSEYSLEELSFFCRNQFLKIKDDSTKCIVEVELKIESAVFNFFLALTAIPLKWQRKKVMNRFKEFAEKYYPANSSINSA